MLNPDDLRFFDPNDEFAVSWNRLPHWTQAGTVMFITWRTADSLPQAVMRQWEAHRDELLREHGINPLGDWQTRIQELPHRDGLRIRWQLIDRFDERLDDCHGACVLRQPELSQIVADSLLTFDGERYLMTDFCALPNHVHLLAAFASEDAAGRQISGWKRYQARQINSALGRNGAFWQERDFDHLVRSADQFQYYRRYIAENGRNAGLGPDEYQYWSREL